jgi:hypothetical protein
MLYVDKTYNVPLRTRHWNEAGVEVKKLEIPRDKIRNFAGVWIPLESTMYDLTEATNSVLYVDRVVENPSIPDRVFSPQRLPSLHPLASRSRGRAASGAGADEQGR